MLANALHRADPDAPALVAGRTTSYGDLSARQTRWRDHLAAAGVRAADRVVLRVDSRPDLVAALFATWEMGATAVPLDSSKPLVELTAAVEAADARFVVADGELLARLPVAGDVTALDDAHRVLVRRTSAADYGHAPALFVFSSGTTGGPAKCVSFGYEAIEANVAAMVEVLGWTSQDRCATPLAAELPAALVNAVLPSLAVGAAVCWPTRRGPRALVACCAGATIVVAVPFVYELLCRGVDGRALAEEPLRWCVATSAPARPELVELFHHRTGHLLHSMYCSSEAGSCTLNTGTTVEECTTSVGLPLPGVRLRVQADEPGQPGEVVVCGPLTASGYVGRPEEDREVFRSDGVHTGDLGHLDEHGRLHLTGRRSALINCGGHTVDPVEVQQVLEQHPHVHEALVYGEADDRRGTRVVAAVVTRAPITRADLVAHCRDRVAPHKVPQRFDFVPHLERGPLGKPRPVTS